MSQEATDCLPEAKSKSGVTTQLDDTVTMDSTNDQEENEPIGHTSVTAPEILTVSDCQERVQSSSSEARVSDRMMPPATDEDVSFMILEAAASAGLPLNVVEALIREEEDSRTSHDAVTILDQEMIPEEFSFFSPDPVSTLDIQGSAAARSDQGIAQVTCSLPSSSASLEVVQENGVQPPNISNGGSTLNALALTSLPNNPMGQSPLRHLFSNPYDYEIEKLRIEEENGNKNFEETTSKLMAELERKMAEIRCEYDSKAQELDANYNAGEMEREANKRSVEMSSLLANAYKSKCADVSTSDSSSRAALRAIISQYETLQQEAAQTSSRMNSTAPLSHIPRRTTTQPRPIPQEVIDIDTYVNSTDPPRPSVTATEAPTPNPQGPLSHLPSRTTTQPRPIPQEVIEIDTYVDSTAPPRPSVTATEAPTPNPQGPLSHLPTRTTTQPTPISQQTVQTNTNVSSTAPPRPSVTTAEPPTTNPPGPHSHFPPCTTTTQPTQMSQHAPVQENTHMSSTAPPQPSVTAAEAPLSQPTPVSQQAPVQANTHTSATAPPPQPQPSVTAAEPPTPNPSDPLSHLPRCTTAQSTQISQQIPVQANKHLSSTGLPRPSVTSEALSLHSPHSNTPPQPRPPPVISNLTPSSSTAVSSPLAHGTVRGPAPHLKRAPAPHIKPFPSSRDPISAGASTKRPRLVQEQQQQQGNSNVGLVYLSDDE